MHMDISEEPFYAGIYRKNAGDQMELGFSPYRKNPSVWTHCLGKKEGNKSVPVGSSSSTKLAWV